MWLAWIVGFIIWIANDTNDTQSAIWDGDVPESRFWSVKTWRPSEIEPI